MPEEEFDVVGGDVDVNKELAEVEGDEAVGGTAPTPDQDIVDNVAGAMGVEIGDRKPVRMTDMLERRDDSRWELDPESSDDYEQR